MIYILIALALMGALTVVLSRQSEQTDQQGLTDEMAQFESAQILAYAQTAQSVVDKMIMSGTSVTDLDFTQPNVASFDNPPYHNKVYHPQGGGLTYKPWDAKLFNVTTNPIQGWYMGRFNNTVWTPTGADDVMLTAYNIKKPICEAINEKITGSKTIPPYLLSTQRGTLIDDDLQPMANTEFGTDDCNACNGMAMLCTSNTTVDIFTFYAIIVAR